MTLAFPRWKGPKHPYSKFTSVRRIFHRESELRSGTLWQRACFLPSRLLVEHSGPDCLAGDSPLHGKMILRERPPPSKERKYVPQSQWRSSRCKHTNDNVGSAWSHYFAHAARSFMVPDDRDFVGDQFGAANRGRQDPLHLWSGHYASRRCHG